MFGQFKDCGIKIVYRSLNPTPENTRAAEDAGVDIIVATCFDEGGTLPGMTLGTFSIVPLIKDAVKNIPVMAQGALPIVAHSTRRWPLAPKASIVALPS